MLLFFVTCFSFILFYKHPLSIKTLPSWAYEMRLLSFYLWKYLSILFPFLKSLNNTLFINFNSNTNQKGVSIVNSETTEGPSLLDLPELALESILEKLEPDALCRMACVSTHLRDTCLSDHLWKGHMNQKWGRVIGSAAQKEWQLQKELSKKQASSSFLDGLKERGILMGFMSNLWPVMLVKSSLKGSVSDDERKPINVTDDHSVVSFYRALETGKFWFPAQVFNRENGHVGFVLSCYDAELSYDSRTDAFEARYPPHGRRAVATEGGISWDRIRAAPVDTSPYDLHIADSLNDLRPRDHIEIQWRRNKQFPYGWWYGVVCHLETCDGNDMYCHCHESDTVVLEFGQYAPGSRWRHTMISRKDHREEGNEIDGFYGGIRKLYKKDDISMWKPFWPTEILE